MNRPGGMDLAAVLMVAGAFIGANRATVHQDETVIPEAEALAACAMKSDQHPENPDLVLLDKSCDVQEIKEELNLELRWVLEFPPRIGTEVEYGHLGLIALTMEYEDKVDREKTDSQVAGAVVGALAALVLAVILTVRSRKVTGR